MIEKYIINKDYGLIQLQHEKLIGCDLSASLGLARFALKGVRNIEHESDSGILTVEYDEMKTDQETLIAKAESLLAKRLA